MFEEGLRYELREKLTPADLESCAKLKVAVIRAERLVKKRSKLRTKKGLSKIVESSNRKQGGHFNYRSRGFGTPSFIGRGQSHIVAQRSACVHYGRQHSEECRKLIGGCFFCRSLNHMLRDCPKTTRVTGG